MSQALTLLGADSSHQSLTRIEWFPFSGKPGEDVLLFVQAITRFALSLERQRDSEWMATYAYGCLKDEALRWYETLDVETRMKWFPLRERLVAKFGVRELSLCRIKVLREKGDKIGYVGYLDENAETKIETSVTEAMVLYMPSAPPQEGITLSYVTLPGVDKALYPFLGVQEAVTDRTWWALRAVDGGKPHAHAFPASERPAEAPVWSLKKNDDGTEELTAQWTEESGSLTALVYATYPEWISDPLKKMRFWLRKRLLGTHEPLRLVLERL